MKKVIDFELKRLNNPVVIMIVTLLLVVLSVKFLAMKYAAINESVGDSYANRSTLATCVIDLKKKYTEYDEISEYYVYDVMEQDASDEERYYMTRFKDTERNEVYKPYIDMVKGELDNFDPKVACLMLEAALKTK